MANAQPISLAGGVALDLPGGARPSVRVPGLGTAALAGAVATSLWLAAGASSQHLSFFVPAGKYGTPEWMRGPLSELDLPLTHPEASLLLVVLAAFYVLALVVARDLSLRAALVAIGCAQLAFMVAAPLYSADIFSYLSYARLDVLHGIDPYLHGAAAAPHDLVRPYVRWHDAATPYGPLFTIATYPLAWLGVPAAFWTLKLLAGAASLACVGLVARIARQLDRPVVPAVLLVGLNPVLLAYGVGGGHNDFFAVLVMLAGITLALGRLEGAGSASFVVAAALKAPAGVALAFLLVARRSRRGIAAAAASAVGVATIAVVAFGGGAFAIVRQIAGQQQAVAQRSAPSEVAGLLGLGGVTTALHVVVAGTLVLGLAWLLWVTWRGGDWLRATGWATLLVLVTSSWLLPWYIVWLLPIAAVAGDPRLRVATLAFTAFVLTTLVAHSLLMVA
jgi:alpha-1,6-mannosyltransferase